MHYMYICIVMLLTGFGRRCLWQWSVSHNKKENMTQWGQTLLAVNTGTVEGATPGRSISRSLLAKPPKGHECRQFGAKIPGHGIPNTDTKDDHDTGQRKRYRSYSSRVGGFAGAVNVKTISTGGRWNLGCQLSGED